MCQRLRAIVTPIITLNFLSFLVQTRIFSLSLHVRIFQDSGLGQTIFRHLQEMKVVEELRDFAENLIQDQKHLSTCAIQYSSKIDFIKLWIHSNIFTAGSVGNKRRNIIPIMKIAKIS